MRERGNPVLRWLDRYVGIPLIFFLGCFKRKKNLKASERIAILITGGIGDTVLLTGILQDLLQDLNVKSITLFTTHSNAGMAQLIPGITVIPLSFFSFKKLRKDSFDVWIDANPWPRINALFSFFAKARFKIGYRTPKQYRHYVYDHVVPHSKECHEIDNMRALIKVLGVDAKHPPHLAIDGEKKSPNTIALHLFAGGSRAYLKEWPEEKWNLLMNILVERGFSLVLTGSPQDKARLEKICGSLKRVEVVAGKLTLEETARLLRTVRAIITIDTGIMHLAAAVGCPTIALHGPTSPKRWGAIGEKVIALQWNKEYKPCIHLGFESRCVSNACMQGIEVASVLNALSTLSKTS